MKVTGGNGTIRGTVCIDTLSPLTAGARLETHGPLGTVIAGLGLGAFYCALIWVNLLLGHMLTPLFLIPLTWLQDKVLGRRRAT